MNTAGISGRRTSIWRVLSALVLGAVVSLPGAESGSAASARSGVPSVLIHAPRRHLPNLVTVYDFSPAPGANRRVIALYDNGSVTFANLHTRRGRYYCLSPSRYRRIKRILSSVDSLPRAITAPPYRAQNQILYVVWIANVHLLENAVNAPPLPSPLRRLIDELLLAHQRYYRFSHRARVLRFSPPSPLSAAAVPPSSDACKGRR
jgi:hypothetical protein